MLCGHSSHANLCTFALPSTFWKLAFPSEALLFLAALPTSQPMEGILGPANSTTAYLLESPVWGYQPSRVSLKLLHCFPPILSSQWVFKKPLMKNPHSGMYPESCFCQELCSSLQLSWCFASLSSCQHQPCLHRQGKSRASFLPWWRETHEEALLLDGHLHLTHGLAFKLFL